jgi:hypothetical protein
LGGNTGKNIYKDCDITNKPYRSKQISKLVSSVRDQIIIEVVGSEGTITNHP